MRPLGISTANSGLFQWNSPLPYLFGGLMLIFGIIAVALLLLACCHTKYSSSVDQSQSPSEKEDKPAKTVQTTAAMEPKIVVIMAGDDHPTYIARPSTASTSCAGQEEEV